jgi:hypothetical protein
MKLGRYLCLWLALIVSAVTPAISGWLPTYQAGGSVPSPIPCSLPQPAPAAAAGFNHLLFCWDSNSTAAQVDLGQTNAAGYKFYLGNNLVLGCANTSADVTVQVGGVIKIQPNYVNTPGCMTLITCGQYLCGDHIYWYVLFGYERLLGCHRAH